MKEFWLVEATRLSCQKCKPQNGYLSKRPWYRIEIGLEETGQRCSEKLFYFIEEEGKDGSGVCESDPVMPPKDR